MVNEFGETNGGGLIKEFFMTNSRMDILIRMCKKRALKLKDLFFLVKLIYQGLFKEEGWGIIRDISNTHFDFQQWKKIYTKFGQFTN